MSNPLDYYDVQAMIRDARSEIRGEIDNAIRAARLEIREEIHAMRIGIGEELDSIIRVLNSRTEHLA